MVRPIAQILQLGGIFLVGLVLTGCATSDTSKQEDPVVLPSGETVEQAPLPAGVTAQGVVLASLLLANGDIERAVEAALVSPEEVELAREAIETDTLQEWIDRASSE